MVQQLICRPSIVANIRHPLTSSILHYIALHCG